MKNINFFLGWFFTGLAQGSKILTGFFLLKLIAVYLGPGGLGKLGHFLSIVTLMSVFAGGGIVNGIIKYVAEYKNDEAKLKDFMSSSFFYTCLISFVVTCLGVLFSVPISDIVFGDDKFRWIIISLFLMEFTISFSNYTKGVFTGLDKVYIFTYIQIFGNILGILAGWACIYLFGFSGAAIAVIFIQAFYFVPSVYFFFRFGLGKKLKQKLNFFHFKNLSKYSLMLFTSAVSFPVVEILIRQMIIEKSGYDSAGVWQSSIKISAAYMGFFNIFLAYYFVPRISPEKNKKIIFKQVVNYSAVLSLVFLAGSFVLFFYKAFFINLLLSKDFILLGDYIAYQLTGDFFKLISYTIGYVAVAKAAFKLYIVAEIFQNLVFWGLSFFMYKTGNDIISIFKAYQFTYIIYFFAAIVFFLFYLKRNSYKSIQV